MKIITTIVVAMLLVASYVHADIRVVSTKGETAYMDGRAWRTMSAGQRLSEGTTVSTGANSEAVIMIDRHELILKPLTTMKLYRHRVDKDGSDTDVGIKHGGVRARVNRVERLRTNFNISTPVATSSVRGTEQEVTYGPSSGMRIKVIDGEINAHNSQGADRNVKGRSRYSQQPDKVRPEPLLDETRQEALISVTAEGTTPDERAGLDVFGDQLVDNTESGYDFFVPADGMATVEMDITWPGAP